MIANYHTHTWRCRHADGTEREYVETAIEAGLKILGFSDHTPQVYPGGYVCPVKMLPEELGGYVDTVLDLKREYKDDEAACVAVVYAFILAVIVYRDINLKDMYVNLRQTVSDGSGILIIICGAAAFSWLVTMMGMTDALSHALTSLTDNKYIMLLILNIAFLIIGMFMEALAVMTITVPFLIPLMSSFGIDPVHLGVVLEVRECSRK